MRADIRSIRPLIVAAVGTVALLSFAACGGSSDETTTTTSTTTTAPASTTTPADDQATKLFDEQIQKELQEVGCYKGNIDGILGPASDEAILEFQRAEGLSADGELGPRTEAALKSAVAAGRKVCVASSTTTTAPRPTTTSAANDAPCTATALLKGLPAEGEKITRFLCSGGWAAGSLDNGSKFILQARNGAWVAPSQDPCGSASAGLDPAILEAGCGG